MFDKIHSTFMFGLFKKKTHSHSVELPVTINGHLRVYGPTVKNLCYKVYMSCRVIFVFGAIRGDLNRLASLINAPQI